MGTWTSGFPGGDLCDKDVPCDMTICFFSAFAQVFQGCMMTAGLGSREFDAGKKKKKRLLERLAHFPFDYRRHHRSPFLPY